MAAAIILVHKVCATIVLVLGTLVNAVNIIAVVKSKLYRKNAVKFILTLMITELILCVFAMTTNLTNIYFNNTTEDAWCRISGFVVYTMIGAECMNITTMSILAFLSITRLNFVTSLLRRKRNLYFLLILIWIVPFVLLLFPLSEVWGRFSFGKDDHICQPIGSGSSGIFLGSFALSVTVCGLVVSYIGIIRKVRQSFRKVQSANTKSTLNLKEQKRKQSERQLMINSVLSVTFFIVLYFPEAILPMVDPEKTLISPYVHVTVEYVGWSHVIVNTVIYTLFNSHIRRACMGLFHRSRVVNPCDTLSVHTVQ